MGFDSGTGPCDFVIAVRGRAEQNMNVLRFTPMGKDEFGIFAPGQSRRLGTVIKKAGRFTTKRLSVSDPDTLSCIAAFVASMNGDVQFNRV